MNSCTLEYSYKRVLLFTIITFFAIITHESVSGLILTIPQLFFILYLLYHKKILEAYKWHIIFSLTCIAIPFSSIIAPGIAYELFNYSKLKLIGPVSVSLIITLMILSYTIINHYKFVISDKLFYNLCLLLSAFAFYGILLGTIGLLWFNYNLDVFITFSVYIIPLLLNALIIFALNSNGLKKELTSTLIELLISSPIASLLCYLFHITSLYSNDIVIPQNELGYYSFLLLFSVIFIKKWILPFIAAILSLWLMKFGGEGGKGIIINCVILIFFLSILFKNKNILFKQRVKIFRLIIIIIFFFSGVSIYNIFISNNLFIWKLQNIASLFDVFDGIDAIAYMPNSPRIRIVSLIDIIQGFQYSPLSVIFGTGYGGYFYDHLNILSQSDLSHAFSDYEINTGRYSRPHDTYAAVPLVNGVIGLFLLVKTAIQYIKNYKTNFFSLAAVPWLLLTFYYNAQFAIIGLLLLYISSSNLQKRST